ncbi:Zn-ribbon domain-containing OB-fold protein [Devosia nitrariae]|uniref:DNA-binding protein n=1 Tax=Devosia nitrariae TaxID=2071872 RepID=A0ABQ5W815_9HYPH|nr:OB-fold domain-containing protein [Devosia nitrariae]GLQ56207.1 hypothetical protein GCM10010862_34660 [Devosia nitrariae]
MISPDLLADLKVPGPTETALSGPFWEAAERGQLLVQHCSACNRSILYPRRICPHCWSVDLSWQVASGRATLRTWSSIVRPGHPAWEPAAPYTVALAELDEGPTLLTQLRAEPQGLSAGLPLRVVFMRVGGRTLPFFEPAS